MSNILENVSLYQGNLSTDGSFSTSSNNHYQYYVRTDYIDITNYSSISIDVLTQGITVGYYGLYDKDKKFIKYIDIETKLQQQCTCNKEDNVAYIVFDMGDYNLNKKITPSDVNINISFSELLYQGYIEKSGSLSSQTIYSDYHKASVRTDYIDITNYSSVSINIPTQNVTVGYYGLYDKDKKFIKYIDFSSEKLQQCTYNKEDEVVYIVFDVYRDGAEILLPSDVNINIDFSELLYQGYLIETGGFSTYDYDKTYHGRWVRTDYIDIRDKDGVTIDVLSSNDIFIDNYQLLDTNKKFKKYVNIDDLKSFAYQKESGIGYIAFDFYKDTSTNTLPVDNIFPAELEIDIKFSPYDEVVELKNIKIGTSLIQRIYLGNIETSKVYLGNTLVFDVNSNDYK